MQKRVSLQLFYYVGLYCFSIVIRALSTLLSSSPALREPRHGSFVTFVTEVSLRLAAPPTRGALYRRYLASRLALSSPDLFSSAPTTPALPPSSRRRLDTSLSLFPDTFLLCLESD